MCRIQKPSRRKLSNSRVCKIHPRQYSNFTHRHTCFPLSSEFGALKTVTARFWPGLEPFFGRKSLNPFGLLFPLTVAARPVSASAWESRLRYFRCRMRRENPVSSDDYLGNEKWPDSCHACLVASTSLDSGLRRQIRFKISIHHLSTYLSFYLSIYLSIHLIIYLSIYMYISIDR